MAIQLFNLSSQPSLRFLMPLPFFFLMPLPFFSDPQHTLKIRVNISTFQNPSKYKISFPLRSVLSSQKMEQVVAA